jgi:hypothetical protein
MSRITKSNSRAARSSAEFKELSASLDKTFNQELDKINKLARQNRGILRQKVGDIINEE